MMLYGMVWYYMPVLGLAIFILLAAYHFGEIDWPTRGGGLQNRLFPTIYGMTFILFIIGCHIETAAPILEGIVISKVSLDTWIILGQSMFRASSLFLIALLLTLATLYKRLGWSKRERNTFLIQTIILASVVYMLPLYLAFGFYFGLWHSVLSFNLIRMQMSLEANWTGWSKLLSRALPFSLLAWIGILLLVFLLGNTQQGLVLSNIFVGIAVLTLPHLQVFTKIR